MAGTNTLAIITVIGLIALLTCGNSRAAFAACSSPAGVAGQILYNLDAKVFQYCNDTNWVKMNRMAGSGSGPCVVAPTDAEGILAYNADHRVMQGCAGNVHRPFGRVGGQLHWTKIDSGLGHTCGIKSDGTLWCWGRNVYGQLGDNSTTQRFEPVQVSGGGTWKQVSNGYDHTCAIKSNDTLWCWGLGTNGRLGNAATAQQQVPVAVSVAGAIPDTWKSVTAGFNYTCAIGSDDTAWCWGNGANGRRGDAATTATQSSPVAVNVAAAIPDTWKSITAGTGHTCAVGSDDTLWCWGLDTSGQRGDAAAAYANTPNPVNIAGAIPDTWKSVSAGDSHTCALSSTDTAWCWGWNNYTEIGDGTQIQRNSPVAVDVSGTIPDIWKSIAAGPRTSCAIATNDSLWCWGDYSLATGTNDFSDASHNIPTAVEGGESWTQVSLGNGSGNDMACGITTKGMVSCWGDAAGNFYGELPVRASRNTPQLKDGGVWKTLATNEGVHHCGIKSDDTLWCWGWNYDGQLGDNSTTNRSAPTQVSGGGSWKQVSVGWVHTCGIKANDTLWCWGYNSYGNLGDNSYTRRLIPTAVFGGGTWKQVASAEKHTCALKSDDTLWCWGADDYSQLGNGAGADSAVPVAVSGGGTWKWLSSGFLHSCGVKSDDTLWCWGDNGYGQLGDNSITARDVPTSVSGGGTWKRVDIGEETTCGIKSNDTLWCWGNNRQAKIGDGSFSDSLVPVAVSGGGTWKQVDGGAWFHSCGIKSDDQLYCWGAGGFGAIGHGMYVDFETSPAAISGGMTWKSVAAAAYNSCAIASNDSLWCWGLLTNSGHPLLPSEMKDDRCSNPSGNAGALIYNSSSQVMQYCDGVGWVRIGKL